jgi:hypothetical protein
MAGDQVTTGSGGRQSGREDATVRRLPEALLFDPVVSTALAVRDFGVVFAAAKAAGLSFNTIAAATGMKAERVSLVARGAATVTAFVTVERIVDGLRIPGGMVGLSPRGWERESGCRRCCRCIGQRACEGPGNNRRAQPGAPLPFWRQAGLPADAV